METQICYVTAEVKQILQLPSLVYWFGFIVRVKILITGVCVCTCVHTCTCTQVYVCTGFLCIALTILELAL